MTTLTVNLLDDTSVNTALRVLGNLTQMPSESPRTMEMTVTDPQAVAPAPAPTGNESAPTGNEPDTSQPDTNGLMWNEAFCSKPASLNADGTWRAKRGKKDDYDAAVIAAIAQSMPEAKSPTTQNETEPSPTATMPTMPAASMPAAPAPTTPAAPIEYDAMARRFMAMMESGAIQDYNAVYQALQIDYQQLETNQTMIAALWHYMDALESGETHDAAVRHALGS